MPDFTPASLPGPTAPWITTNPWDSIQKSEEFYQKQKLDQARLEEQQRLTSEGNTSFPTRLRKMSADTQAAEAEAPYAGPSAAAGLRLKNVQATNAGIQPMLKIIERLDADDGPGAQMIAEQTGTTIPKPVIENRELRSFLAQTAKRALLLYPDRERDQQTYIDSQLKDRTKQLQAGQQFDPATQPYQMPPGAPELPQQKKYTTVKAGETLLDTNNNVVFHADEKPPKMSPTEIRKEADEGGKLARLTGAIESFRPEYAGYSMGLFGDAANYYGRHAPSGAVSSQLQQQADWWANYDSYKNNVRHELFGSALTATETAAWNKADINPGMNPELIQQNLARQKEIVREGIKRKAAAMIRAGQDPRVISAAYGVDLGELGLKDEGRVRPGAAVPGMAPQKQSAPAQAPSSAAFPAMTQSAIDALKADPRRANEFDGLFGPGSAARVLQGGPSGSIMPNGASIMGGGSGEPNYATGGSIGAAGLEPASLGPSTSSDDDFVGEMATRALDGDETVHAYLRAAKGSKNEAKLRQKIRELGKARGIPEQQLAQQDQFACGGAVGNQRYASGGTTGPVTGSDPGRADTRRKTVPKGAFIIPADVVAITGQGNSKAGLGMLKRKFRVGRYADGGGVGNEIQVSDGELVLSPRETASAGGSEALIRWINRVRRDEIARLQSAPQPHHGGTHFDDGGDDGDGEGADAEADADGDGVGDSEDGFDDTGESSTDGIDAEGNAADANMDGVNDVTGDPVGGFEAAAGTTSTEVDDPMGAFGQATPEELAAANNASNNAAANAEPTIDLEPIEVNTAHGVAGNASSPGTSSGPGSSGSTAGSSAGFGGPDFGTDFNVDAGAVGFGPGFWDQDALSQINSSPFAPTPPSPANPPVTRTTEPGVPFFPQVELPPVNVTAPAPARGGVAPAPAGGIFGPNESIIGWDPAPAATALPEITVQAPAPSRSGGPGLSFSARSGEGNAFDPANYGVPDALAGVSPGVAPDPGLAFTDRGGFDPNAFGPTAFAPDPVAPSVAQAPAPAAPAYSPAYSPAYAPATPSFSALTPSGMPTYGALTAAGAGSVRPSMYMASGGTVGRRPARWLREA